MFIDEKSLAISDVVCERDTYAHVLKNMNVKHFQVPEMKWN